MKTRLLLAAVCILALPMWFSASKSDITKSVPFVSVAFAGHTTSGAYCTPCGTGDCICDPGERPGVQSTQPISDDPSVGRKGKAKPGRVYDLDLGTGAFLIGLALFMWSRLRA